MSQLQISPPVDAQIVFIGCDHKFQPRRPARGCESQNRELETVIREVISECQIRFIGEEADEGQETLAQWIAGEAGIQYLNIDIPSSIKAAIKHRPPAEHCELEGRQIDLTKTDPYSKAWNLVREYHMAKSVLDVLQPAKMPVLLIVGAGHVEPMIDLFQRYKLIVCPMRCIT